MATQHLSPFRQAVIVGALWAAGLGAAAQFAKVSVPLAELGKVYPDQGVNLALIVSFIGLMGMVLGPFASMIGDRIGHRRLLFVSLIAAAFFSVLQALLPPFPLLLASRVLEGFTHLGIVVAAPTLMGTIVARPYRPAALTLWSTFFGVAFALTAWLGAPLVAASGVAGLFVAHAVFLSLVAVLLALVLPSSSGGEVAPRHVRDFGATVLAYFRTAYTTPAIAGPALGWMFYAFTFVALLTAVPGLVGAQDRTFVAAAMPLANIAVALTLGVLLVRFLPAIWVVCIGFAGGILTALALLALPQNALMFVALFAILGLVQGASFAAIPQLNQSASAQGLANGAITQCGNVGNLVGTPLILAIAAKGSLTLLMWTIIACYGAGIAVHLLLSLRAR